MRAWAARDAGRRPTEASGGCHQGPRRGPPRARPGPPEPGSAGQARLVGAARLGQGRARSAGRAVADGGEALRTAERRGLADRTAGRRTADGGRRTADGGRRTADGGRRSVGRGRQPRRAEQTVGRARAVAGSRSVQPGEARRSTRRHGQSARLGPGRAEPEWSSGVPGRSARRGSKRVVGNSPVVRAASPSRSSRSPCAGRGGGVLRCPVSGLGRGLVRVVSAARHNGPRQIPSHASARVSRSGASVSTGRARTGPRGPSAVAPPRPA